MISDAALLFSDSEKTGHTLNRFREYLDDTFVNETDFASYVAQQIRLAAPGDQEILSFTNSSGFLNSMSAFYSSFAPVSPAPMAMMAAAPTAVLSADQAGDCSADLGPDAPWYVESLLGGGAGLASDLAGKTPYLKEGPLVYDHLRGGWVPDMTPQQLNYKTWGGLSKVLGGAAFFVGAGFSAWEIKENIGSGDYAEAAKNAAIVGGSITLGLVAAAALPAFAGAGVVAAIIGAGGALAIDWAADEYTDDWFDSILPSGDLPKQTPCGREPAPYIPEVLGPFQDGEAAAGSPLVIDMDGDGIELASLDSWGAVYWDIDKDGFKEKSGWISGGDALLAMDRNANGVIDDNGELFGNDATYANGFNSLKTFDSNNDNKITSTDQNFSKLRVWIDKNEDGYSQAGELFTLAQKNITQINLGYTNVNYEIEGNSVRQESTVIIGGQTRKIADVWFTYDNVNTLYNQDFIPNIAALAMPTLRGYGKLPDLHISMSQDGTLLTMMESLTNATANQVFSSSYNLEGKITDILFRWAHVESVDPNSRGSFDARQLGFLEAFLGETFRDSATSIVNPRAVEALQQSWNNVLENLTVRILAQSGHLNSLFMDSGEYNPITDTLTGVFTPNITGLAAIKPAYAGDAESYTMTWKLIIETMNNLTDMTAISTANKNAINAMVVQSSLPGITFTSILNAIISDTPILTGDDAANALFGNDLANYMSASGGNDIVFGLDGNDYIYGGAGNDRLYGQAGDDYLSGDDGDDILSGGTGNNTLYGAQGNDTYLYTGGLDRISDYAGTDTIKFATGIVASNITLQRDPNLYNLNILLNGLIASVVENHFQTNYGIEKILFSNGTSINLAQFQNVNGTTASETLNGHDNSILRDDVIYGNEGNDTLNGKVGNDYLFGGSGNDKYVYSNGSDQGTDRIRDDEGTADSIVLGAAYTSANITLERVGQYDLAIKSAGKTLVLIDGQFNGSGAIETLVYGNGASLNLLNYSHTVNGTSLADTIYGTSYGAGADKLNGLGGSDAIYAGAGNDIVTGGAGDDYLYGEDGNDTLSGNAGNDYVHGGLGNDTIIYETGLDRLSDSGGTDVINITNSAITSANLTLRRTVGNQSDLDVLLNGTHAFTLAGQFYQNGGFETIKFANGTTFNLTTIQYTSTGTSAADYLYGISYGGNPNDIMNGGAGNDYLQGYDGNDILDGGTGTDRLYGGAGNDIYKVSLNAGVDTISDEAGTDTIQFGNGFNKTNMTVQRDTANANNLNILFGGALAVTVENHFSRGYLLETIKFADNTTYNLAGVSFTQNGTSNSDYFYGYDGVDILKGNGGNDYLYGYAGNDTLDGGVGNDYLYGGLGNDTYVLNAGFGSDYISDEGGTDVIQLGAGIAASDLRYENSGSNLIIYVGTSGDKVTLEGQFYDLTNGTSYYDEIETLKLSNGTSINLLSGLTFTGTSSGEYVYGTKIADTIVGLGGNDYLYGGLGNDTYVLNAGFGSDYISDEGGTDVIQLGAGIAASDLRYENSGSNLIIYVGTSGDKVTLEGQFYDLTNGTSYYDEIETLKLSNGTSINLLSGLTFTGTSSNDSMSGTGATDKIVGLAGNDYLYGYAGNDTLDGGVGNDYLYGGLGNDTYVLNAGFGSDYISDEGGTDVIQLGAGIAASDLRYENSGSNLIIYVGTSGDKVTLEGQFYDLTNGTSYYDEIETLKLSNGTSINLLSGLTFTGTSSGEYVYGTKIADTIVGLGGNDYLYGGLGNDTYVLNAGFGSDYISDEGGTDVIQLGAGIAASDLRYENSGSNLIIYVGTSGDKVTLEGQFYDLTNGTSYYDEIETLKLSNGTSINLLSGLTFTGTSSGEYVYGTKIADMIVGLGGNDYLYGGLGDDSYVFGAVDGLDYISDDGGIDVIRLATGVTTENISISDYSSYDTKIIVSAGVNEIQISNQRYTGNDYAVEELQFSDGFITDLLTYKSWVWGSTAAQTTNGSANADTIFGRGGNDTINGAVGNDALHGGSGNDVIKGGDGNDLVHGSIGNDSLYGDAGNDILFGDDGVDNIWGGTGSDTFMFLKETAFKNIDVMNDFSGTQLDKINVKDLLQGFDPLTKAITDYVQISTSGSDSILSVDTDGGANGFIQIATIKGVTGLTDEAALMTSGNLIV